LPRLQWPLPKQAHIVSLGFRNCYVARIRKPLNASNAPLQLQAVLPRLQSCNQSRWTLPKEVLTVSRGFHVACFRKLLNASKAPLQLQAPLPRLQGIQGRRTLPKPAFTVSVSLRFQNCYGKFRETFKPLKPSGAAFGTLSKAEGSCQKKTYCFYRHGCQAAKTSLAVSTWFRHCYVAPFRKPLNASNAPLQLSAPLPTLQGCNQGRRTLC
jgi:hypothetical protein